MRSVNKVILIGNVTRDPQVRKTDNNQSVCTFGLATNRRWTTSDGQQHDMAEFHELVAWSRLSEVCEKHVRKGKLLYIEGYLKTRSWDTPEGVKKFKTEVIVQDLIMLEKRGDGTYEERKIDDSEQMTVNSDKKNKTIEEDTTEEMKEEEEEKETIEETPAEESAVSSQQSEEETEEEKAPSAIDMDLGL